MLTLNENFFTQDVRPVGTITQLNLIFGRDFTQKSCPKMSTPAPSAMKTRLDIDICMKFKTNAELKLVVVVAEVPTPEEQR